MAQTPKSPTNVAPTTPKRIALIICSTRSPQIGPTIALAFLVPLFTSLYSPLSIHFPLFTSVCPTTVSITPVDITTFNLRPFDEPIFPKDVPIRASYTEPHTIRWSKEISSYHGFIFLTRQYNGGHPASAKNAINFLYNEWTKKLAMVVSYGHHGGGKGGKQLGDVLRHMRLQVTEGMSKLKINAIRQAMGEGTLEEGQVKTWEKEVGTTVRDSWSELLGLMGERISSCEMEKSSEI